MTQSAIEVALGALEAVELRSLAWGFVDQSLSEPEAEESIEIAFSGESISESPAEVLDVLVDRMLVRVIRDESGRRYRTRIAEMVRLLARSRQWFDGQPWQAAASLVSDYRVDIRPRYYPRRSISPEDAWNTISSGKQLSPLQGAVWSALTGRDVPFMLSRFQLEAAERIIGGERGIGTIVTAGTGSGKTLAFYLPALVSIAPEIRRNEWWTKVLCIYPRQELLKDQLSEAFALVLRSAAALERDGRRAVSLGGLFGPTPSQPTIESVSSARWDERPGGFLCPFVRCPTCGSEMTWSRQSLDRGRETLGCIRQACNTNTDPSVLRLTRKSIQESPPDLLFTTTEMMNQRLSDTQMRRLFGVGQNSARTPLLTLLDEVHTYAGVTGAQTALLLRRWSALLGAKMQWAGLSATLPQATTFLADLTGLPSSRVACIAPAPDEMVSEGAEYQLIARADPSSQTSTLSTTIQAIMLLARMLDHPEKLRSGGLFGSKTFVFTDDLDVTHRLFDDLLDAEAYNARRRPNPNRMPLAALRSGARPEAIEREELGQRWQMAEDLRGSLSDRLVVSRTTSRDPGVDAAASVVVATSALEVGFNDPYVGAVLQHKAPRSAASFLQRRGRAGRQRGMRPLTMTVLSDYGRDRVAFQSYEQLFNPVIEIQSLPLRNLYVLRMQAVYATLDWVAAKMPTNTAGWAWRTLAGPPRNAWDREFRDYAKELLRRVLRFEEQVLDDLKAHLRRALSIDVRTLDSVLWHPPRSLLLEALPTLARRMFREWRRADGSGLDLHSLRPPHPLPDFVPANLFSDLNLPEVQVFVPGRPDEPEVMPIVSAIQQFAPGRVRRRFADQRGDESHWFPVDLTQLDQRLKVSEYVSRREFVGVFEGKIDERVQVLPVYRPWELQLSTVPRTVSTSSNSVWKWQSELVPLGDSSIVDLPQVASLGEVVDRLEFRLHRFGSGISVRRFAHEAFASVRVGQAERFISIRMLDDNDLPAAVGFAFEADGMCATLRVPGPGVLARMDLPPELSRWLRYLAFRHRTLAQPALPHTVNHFRREWLHQIVLLTAVVLAEESKQTLADALRQLRDSDNPADFRRAIEALVDATVPPDGDDDSMGAGTTANPTRLHQSLFDSLSIPLVRQSLIDLAIKWTSPSNDDWGAWLNELASGTIAEAIYQACLTVVPHSAATEGLTADTKRSGDRCEVYVAETILGGGGTIEAVAEHFAADPRAFVRALESACAPSDQEMAAESLRRVLAELESDHALAQSLAKLRSAVDTEARDSARTDLFRCLSNLSIPVSRTLSVLLAAHLMRPGAGPTSDSLALSILRAWQALEERHGVALPARIAAAAVVLTAGLNERLVELGGHDREILTANLLVWPSGGELRQRALQSYNPYRAAPIVDAMLARLILFETRLPVVVSGIANWVEQVKESLATKGAVRLVTEQGEQQWRTEITSLLSMPIVSGFLQFYAMIESTRVLGDGRIAIDLVLRERT